jgi:Concanavalin A-like lectin/glucanases superfamily
MEKIAKCRQSRPGLNTPVLLAALGLVFLAAAGSVRADIHDNLVVHLNFDGDVLDHSGHGNDGTIGRPSANSPYVPGIIGMAFHTQGSGAVPDFPTGSYITLGNRDDLNFGATTDFSISWWGQYLGQDQHDDIPWLSNKQWNSGTNLGWVLASEGGGTIKLNYRALGEGRRDSSHVGGGLDDGQWHHYVVTFTRGPGGYGIIYLDGVDVSETLLDSTGSLSDPNCALATNILQDGTGIYTDGSDGANWDNASIDDLGIWRRTVTADEVALIYTLGLQGISALDP